MCLLYVGVVAHIVEGTTKDAPHGTISFASRPQYTVCVCVCFRSFLFGDIPPPLKVTDDRVLHVAVYKEPARF